jgi:4-amino-4-deoxy-L-arabinose transferase-like glycosyltransferase
MGSRYTISTKLTLACLSAIFAVQVYWAVTRPIGTGEAYLYDRFVRPTTRQVLASELLDRDVLYSLLEKRSVGLFHVSPFSVRLPSLLFGIFYLCSSWYLCSRWRLTRRFPVAVVVMGAIPLGWGWFAHADGTGVALALCTGAICFAVERKHLNWIGLCLGLSISANVAFAIPAMVLALLILAVQRRWSEWCNQVVIPGAVVVLMVLVLPLSHAHSAAEDLPELTQPQAAHLKSALAALRASAGWNHVGIAAVPVTEPVANFYRAQHRATNWLHVGTDVASEHLDYYLVSAADEGRVAGRHLIVIYRDADFLVLRRPVAPM